MQPVNSCFHSFLQSSFIILSYVFLHFQGTSEYLTFAAVSKLIAAAATYPYQVIRARLQDQNHTYKGAWDCVKQTWRYERLPGFFRGITPTIAHSMPNVVIVMLVWEKLTR